MRIAICFIQLSNSYAIPDANGTRHMLLCQAALGNLVSLLFNERLVRLTGGDRIRVTIAHYWSRKCVVAIKVGQDKSLG